MRVSKRSAQEAGTSQNPTLGWRLMNALSCCHQRPPRSNSEIPALCKMFVIRATKQSAEFGYGGPDKYVEHLSNIVLDDGVMYKQPWAIWLASTIPSTSPVDEDT